MRDFIEIGSSPAGEKCAQFNTPGYRAKAKKEMLAYLSQIRRTLGQEPNGARLVIKWFPHDIGQYGYDYYGEVCCEFDDALPESIKYAFNCGAKSPEYWDDIAKQELGII